MDSSLPDSVVHGIFQAKILKWAAISFFRGSSQPRDQTWVSCIADRRFTVWVTREAEEVGREPYFTDEQGVLRKQTTPYQVAGFRVNMQSKMAFPFLFYQAKK